MLLQDSGGQCVNGQWNGCGQQNMVDASRDADVAQNLQRKLHCCQLHVILITTDGPVHCVKDAEQLLKWTVTQQQDIEFHASLEFG